MLSILALANTPDSGTRRPTSDQEYVRSSADEILQAISYKVHISEA